MERASERYFVDNMSGAAPAVQQPTTHLSWPTAALCNSPCCYVTYLLTYLLSFAVDDEYCQFRLYVYQFDSNITRESIDWF